MSPRRPGRPKLSEPLYPVIVSWLMQDPLKGLILAASVCIVLWHLLDDAGWDLSFDDASDGDGGGD